MRDLYTQLNRCRYCGRPGFMAWDTDLFSCSREVCKGLAFAEVRRRARRTTLADAPQRYARALLDSLETLEYAFLELEIPVFLDWRLRECDYGDLNGAAVDEVEAVRAATGWPLAVSPALSTTAPPTDDELTIVRALRRSREDS